jgi:hypothetical protein
MSGRHFSLTRMVTIAASLTRSALQPYAIPPDWLGWSG